MSASDGQRVGWPDPGFWERLDHLEARHQRVQSQHKSARRGLERLAAREGDELHCAWDHYCEVIAELDKTTSEFEKLRT